MRHSSRLRLQPGRPHPGRLVILVLLVWWSATPLRAQELEPRAYQNSPVGFHALLFAYSRSSGSILFESTLPIENLRANINSSVTGYFHTFSFFGRSAFMGLTIPYGWGELTAQVEGEPARITRSGLADSRLRLAVNVIGAPARNLTEFISAEKETNVGVSVTLVAPTGQNDSNKLINLGSNRWAFKPEVGLSRRNGRWIFEGAAGWWFFSSNKDPSAGSVQKQDSIASLQAHISYNFPNRMWVGVDGNFFSGGQTKVDGEKSGDFLRNSRGGVTLALPISRRHTLKFNYSNGFVTRAGGDFSIFSIAYQFLWLDGT